MTEPKKLASTGAGKLKTYNPATGELLAEVPKTPLSEIPKMFEQARLAQAAWSALKPKKRAKRLYDLRETIIDHADELIDLISKENGKPAVEAMSHDLLPSIDLLTYFCAKGPKLLKDKNVRLNNPIFLHRQSYLQRWPMGVVAVIAPWNFPFLLPFGDIAMALLTGNAVMFKPSEVTPLVGLKIQALCEEAGLPKGIIQTVIGEGDAGAAIIKHKPAKVFFTGSATTGRKIMQACSEHLIPLTLELGGKDPMVVLPDADLDYATSAALWGGFANAGQVCASTERLIVHESIAAEFKSKLEAKAKQLKQGIPSVKEPVDLGAITMEKQKAIYDAHLKSAETDGVEIAFGGKFSTDRRFLQPTLIDGPKVEQSAAYREETFGPTIAMTTFSSIDEAITKANDTPYGLLASVISKNSGLAEEVARQIHAGTVCINEVTYTAGLPETPWGGVKESGFGTKHSDRGLLEFVHTRHINKPRFSSIVFKSYWWYPYTKTQFTTFRQLMELYRKNPIRKLLALPMFLFYFISMLKRDKRL